MLSSFTHLPSPIPFTPYPLLTPTSAPKSTNTAKPILIVTCTCPPLPSTYLLALMLTFVLFTLRSPLLSRITDDQPTHLAKPSELCPLLTD